VSAAGNSPIKRNFLRKRSHLLGAEGSESQVDVACQIDQHNASQRKPTTQLDEPTKWSTLQYAEVEVKVERKPDSFDLSLDLNLNLNLPERWRTFSASC
jgi:hypothetical protein